jgi:hypothetical protein
MLTAPMRGSLRHLIIALRSSPTKLPLVAMPVVLIGWIVGVIFLRGPNDPVVDWLSWAAVAGGLMVMAGGLFDVLSLRHKYPPLIVAGGAACLLFTVACLIMEPSWALLFRLSVPLLVTGLLWFYTFYFSVFRGRELTSKLRVGDRFPAFSLPDSTGRPTTLAAVVADGPALLLFYKGDW